MAQDLRLLMAPSPRRLPLALLFPEIVMDHISTLTLHQLRYNELDAEEAAAVRAHVDGCARCQGRLQVMASERAAFALEPMPAGIAALVAAQQRPPWWQRLLGGLRHPAALGALAVAAALLVFVSLPPGAETFTSRGEQAAVVHVEGHGILDLDKGDVLRAGDRIQLEVPPGDWEQAWIGDAEGLIASFPLEPLPNKWQFIPIAMDVDGAGSEEHIVIVLSNHPLTEQEAQAAADGERLGGVSVQELALPKER